jgi:PAS domain S-box-containing protein
LLRLEQNERSTTWEQVDACTTPVVRVDECSFADRSRYSSSGFFLRWTKLMDTTSGRLAWKSPDVKSIFRTLILASCVAALCYLAARLGGALVLHPQNVWPFWPGCAFLVSVLLLVPRRIWPILIAVALGAFALYDLQEGVPVGSVLGLIVADTVEVVTAALLVTYAFEGIPRLDSVKALAKYSLFAVIIAPLAVSFLGVLAWRDNYWINWRLSFFSEAIAFLTLPPAILGWRSKGPAWAQKSRGYYLEAAALLAGLVFFGWLTFAALGKSSPPALLYSLVPFLLWAALRFGSTGVSTAMLVIALLSIWGATHGRGPFTGQGTLENVLSLQLFLLFATVPFMVFAALVEERQRGVAELREDEERIRLGMVAAKMMGWEWDIKSGRNPWFGETHTVMGMTLADSSGSIQDFWDRVHPEDHDQLSNALEIAKRDRLDFDQEFRVVWPDKTVHWLRSTGRFFYTADGKPERMMGVLRNVTVRKLALESARQRETELREAQRLAKIGSWKWDLETDTVNWSEELYRIAGRDPNLPAVSYQEHRNLYAPESWERLQRAVEEGLRTGTPYELDLEMIRSDGAKLWLVARGETLRNNSGRIVQFRGTVQDITERKHAEEVLQGSEEKFRSVFRDAGIGMAIVSPEGRFLAGNEAFSKFIGYNEEELLARTVQSITHPEDWSMFSQKLSQVLADGVCFQGVEKRCLHKNGQVLWGECSASLIRDVHGNPQYFVAEVLDITERKQAGRTLRESEERFRLVANKAPVLMWMSGIDKLCTFFNQCWLEFTGRSMEHELGEGWASGVHPEDLAGCLGIYSAAFDARVDFEMEYRLKRFDGKYRWIVDYGVPRFESDGTFCGYIGSCIDITDRKLSEASLEELSGRLINAQEQERTRIARELHDDFSQRLALQGIGLTQLWKKLPEEEVEERAKVQDLLKRTQEISSDLHSLSHQLHSSKLEHVGLASALMGLCKEFSSKFKIQIEFTDRADSFEIPKDVALCLFRIAQEALSNVFKHSQAKEAQVELSGAKNEIRLRIVDAGLGFDPALQNGEAGLGLISMRERLRLVGGRFSVHSVPMHGTEVVAEVPLSLSTDGAEVRSMTVGGK